MKWPIGKNGLSHWFQILAAKTISNWKTLWNSKRNQSSEKDLINLWRFRCQNHKLPQASYSRESFRKSTQCMSDDTGEEFHCVLKWKHFQAKRIHYLGSELTPKVISFLKVMHAATIAQKIKLSHSASDIMNNFNSVGRHPDRSQELTSLTTTRTGSGRLVRLPRVIDVDVWLYRPTTAFS